MNHVLVGVKRNRPAIWTATTTVAETVCRARRIAALRVPAAPPLRREAPGVLVARVRFLDPIRPAAHLQAPVASDRDVRNRASPR